MTKIDIYSGFLGAGKTTLIKKMIAQCYKGQKLVLIENEFGQIGIDGGFLKESGINITEMNSGCICCSLVGDFGKALTEVIGQYDPDRIIIEPSGVGKLSDVIAAVNKVTNDEVTLGYTVAVVDAGKVKVYSKNFGEFYNNQVQTASTIILSRTDEISQQKLDTAVAMLRELNKDATIVTTPWNDLTGEQLVHAMEGESSLAAHIAQLEREHHHHHHQEDEHCCCGHDHDHEHCECGHPHDHEHGHSEKSELPGILLGAGLFVLGLLAEHFLPIPWVYIPLFIAAYLILGREVLFTAGKNLVKGHVFDENFLMSLATLGAFAIGQFPEAVGVMLFYRVGEFFEHKAVERSRSQIMEAVDLRPETVLLSGGETIPAEDAKPGDLLLVRPGDRIPLDGVVIEGSSRIDTAPITGEPVPVTVGSGSRILSGCVNLSGQLLFKVEKPLPESMVTRILSSVENAASRRSTVSSPASPGSTPPSWCFLPQLWR